MRSLKTILTTNELLTFRTIYELGPISRVNIARRLNLTRAALSVISRKLTDFGLIMEVGKGTSAKRRGRKELLLVVNPKAGFVLSVHVTLNSYVCALVSLNGKVINRAAGTFHFGSAPNIVLSIVSESLLQIIENTKIDKDKIFGIGVAIPGIINYYDGSIREQSLSGWPGFKIREYLENELDIPVLLENDVKTLALGEFQFGMGRHVRDMVCLWLGNGIGAGIIHDGRLIRGITSSAGEIGFNEFFSDYPIQKSILTDHKPRYWGDILSITNIEETIRRGIKDGWTTSLTPESNLDDFVSAIETGDPMASYIFQLLTRVLGKICCNIIYTFNPEVLLLSGPVVYQLPRIISDIQTHLTKAILRSPIERVELKSGILGENGVIIGCVALVLDYLFQNSKYATQ